MKTLALLFAVTAFLALAAPPVRAEEAPPDHSFTAQQADSGQSYSPNRQNLAVADPNAASNGKLLVFLSGTGAAPRMYNRVLRVAVEQLGYHAIGLDWPNGFDTEGGKGSNVFGPCGEDAACFAAARLEAFDGQDHTPAVTIAPQDAVLHRLTKALAYLQQTYPNEGWGAFLVNGAPDWSRIVLGGHSNGSGEAAFIATQEAVSGVVLFSGPADSTGTDGHFVPAPWLAGPKATPTSRWWAFVEQHDNAAPLHRFDRYQVTFPALGLTGAAGMTLVDGAAAPYGNAHALMTALTPAACGGGKCTPHNMVAGDNTPLAGDGTAVYRPVWVTMLAGAAGGTAATGAAISATPATDGAAAKTAAAAPAATQAATAPASPPPAPAGIAGLPTPTVVSYQSNGLTLKALLYQPAGNGPFPAYLWNHGSEAMPIRDLQLAKFWTNQGFVFFKPIRAGQGGNPGPYILDTERAIIAKAKAGQLPQATAATQRIALHERANEDVVNAYKWLIAQPFVDKTQVVVGGGSYGGIQTLLTAEADALQNLGVKCFVAMSPAAESWAPLWARRLTRAVLQARAPIYILQAHNDYNLGPTTVLGPLVTAKGGANRCALFPDHVGSGPAETDDPHAQGHGGFFADPADWGATVMAFVKACGISTGNPALLAASPETQPCGAGE